MPRPFGLDWKALHRRLTKLTGDAAAAEDALQDAFVRIDQYKRRHEVKREAALLACAARNIALDHRRRLQRQGAETIDEFEPVLADPSPLQDEVLAARQRLSVVRAVIARLPERTRDVFLMHRLDGMKYREIADRFGISVSAVEKHVARAALRLSEAFGDDEPS